MKTKKERSCTLKHIKTNDVEKAHLDKSHFIDKILKFL